MTNKERIKELMKGYGQLERQAKAAFKKANDAHGELWQSADGSAEAKHWNAEWKRLEKVGFDLRGKADAILDKVERLKEQNPRYLVTAKQKTVRDVDLGILEDKSATKAVSRAKSLYAGKGYTSVKAVRRNSSSRSSKHQEIRTKEMIGAGGKRVYKFYKVREDGLRPDYSVQSFSTRAEALKAGREYFKKNPTKKRRQNKTIITKPKKVVVINKLKNPPRLFVSAKSKITGERVWVGSFHQTPKAEALRRARVSGAQYYTDFKVHTNRSRYAIPLGKSVQKKYRNGYLDLVIHGHAKKTPAGWSLGGKTFKQGKGIVPASRRGFYLDRATGTVFSKKARNVAQGAYYGGNFHPYRSSPDYDPVAAGETGGKPRRTRSKKKRTAVQRAIRTATDKAETRRRKSTTSRLASRSLSRSAGILKGSGSRRQRKNAYEPKKVPALKVRSIAKHAHTMWKRGDNWLQYLDHNLSKEGGLNSQWNRAYSMVQDMIERGSSYGSKAARKSRKRANPSVKTIRKEFAGTLGKASEAFAPIGTPKNVAKLGKLLLIDTEKATIKPTGIVYLCADSKGKLHLCGSKNVPIYSGAAQSFGQVRKLEYETAKPHLYPGQGVISFWHKMGDGGTRRPTLIADGKGGLKFRGGEYKITREGIVG
jgi:hypothetical protein